jgi:hypothetical protein
MRAWQPRMAKEYQAKAAKLDRTKPPEIRETAALIAQIGQRLGGSFPMRSFQRL